MDHSALLDDVLALLADGHASRAARECAEAWAAEPHAVPAALAAVASFWRGDFGAGSAWAGRAMECATADEDRALACAGAALVAGGDLDADGVAPWAVAITLLEDAAEPQSRTWSAVRYLLAEAALVGARIDDARRALDTGPAPGEAWAGHPFAAVMRVCDVRVAAFSGDIARAHGLLEPMRASVRRGDRLAGVIDAVTGLVLGNADDAEGVRRSIDGIALQPGTERDFIDRGVLLLLAFGAIAVGDVVTAARMVFSAGDDGDLGRCTIIDRALGFEMLLVAALAEEDVTSAQTWLAALDRLGDHAVARPTVQRCRARLLLGVGDVDGAVAELESSIATCRREGRGVEAAEGEIVLARARIAGRDVAGASRDLRTLVHASDATGHHAVRRSAAAELGAVRRRLPPVAGGGWGVLSDREAEIARLVLAGHDTDDIAAHLVLSEATVRVHVSRILCAFGVPTRIGLLAAAGGSTGEWQPAPAVLTQRQEAVAELVARGHANAAIAAELGISLKSVDKHVGDIRQRWQVTSRFDLARTWWAAAPRR